MFTSWGDACKQFVILEIGRIYHLKIPEEKHQNILDLFNVTLNKKCIFCFFGEVWSKDTTGGVVDINVSDVEESLA